MLNISHPGRFGDVLWALPTVRALAKDHRPVRLHLPVDPADTTPMRKLVPLLEKQEYLQEIVIREDWSIELEAPRRPTSPPDEASYGDAWVHLGYRDWPTEPLPFYTASLAGYARDAVDWSPWISAAPLAGGNADALLFHWSDRWFELKFGLTRLLDQHVSYWARYWTAPNSRFANEARWYGNTLENVARAIASSRLVVTDCSCVHVLAAAMGKKVVVVEPEENRHHFIFWPGSRQDERGHWKQAENAFGRLIYPVIGGDGKPTFDARHTSDLIKELLHG